jgi:hypothetical protein
LFRIHESGPVSGSWVLAEPKNTNFTKIGGNKNVHGPNPRGISRTQRPSTNFFLMEKFIENLEFFEKPASYSFRKVIYVPTNSLKLQSYLRKSILDPSFFSKFQLWCQI